MLCLYRFPLQHNVLHPYKEPMLPKGLPYCKKKTTFRTVSTKGEVDDFATTKGIF